MKKVTLFAVAAMAVMSLASCKKNHTCTCVSTDDFGSGYSDKVTTVQTAKSSKKDAAAWCTGSTTTSSAGGTYVKPSCTLS